MLDIGLLSGVSGKLGIVATQFPIPNSEFRIPDFGFPPISPKVPGVGAMEIRNPKSEIRNHLNVKVLRLRQLPSPGKHRLHDLSQKLPHLLRRSADEPRGDEERIQLIAVQRDLGI